MLKTLCCSPTNDRSDRPPLSRHKLREVQQFFLRSAVGVQIRLRLCESTMAGKATTCGVVPTANDHCASSAANGYGASKRRGRGRQWKRKCCLC